MNLVKKFQQSDLLTLEKLDSEEEVHSFLQKKGINTDTVASLICQVYRFATINNYNLQQKQKIINLAIHLLTQLPDAQTKQKFHGKINIAVEEFSKRDENSKCSFDLIEVQKIKELFVEKILPYYPLYEIVLDNHPHFQLSAQLSSVVKSVNEKSLSSGTAVEVENIEVLKEFLGIRAAKEEKKDPKKK